MFLISSKTSAAKSDAIWKKAMDESRIDDPIRFAEFMLGKTSRTFALNIQVLPSGLRRQVLLSYLFCRIADTLEDDGELPTETKIELLESFRRLFPVAPQDQTFTASGKDQGELEWRVRLEEFLHAVPAEWARSDRWDRLLVYHCRWIYPQLHEFSEAVVRVISNCVNEMCDGMIRFTAKQAKTKTGLVLIESISDLDDYCYYVAGTVGMLLCELFALKSPLIGPKRAKALKDLSVSFGLGLQLTNILKDIHEDRSRNVSYIPLNLLAKENLTAQSVLTREGHAGATKILGHLIRKTKSHLQDALDYSCLLPRMEPRLRLFCLWPLFMAVETLVVLGENLQGFQEGAKVKISRSQVNQIVNRTSVACWSNHWLRSLFKKPMARLEALLAAVPELSA